MTDDINEKTAVKIVTALIVVLLVATVGYNYLFRGRNMNNLRDCLISLFVGALYGTGFVISGVTKRRKVLGFFSMVANNKWDCSYLIFLVSAMLCNLIFF
jgi:hypothetical protein